MIVRYYASAKAAAGVAEEEVDARDLGSALDAVRARHDERFATVLGVCSFVVDGEPVGTRPHAQVALGEASVAECLPPFAGG